MHYKSFRRLAASLMMCLVCIITYAQTTVTGVVKDAQGYPLPGAAVLVAGTTTGTVTDFDGNFTLGGVNSSDKLQFSFMGFTTQEVAVGSQTNFDITLQDDALNIQEVVAVGYGQMKKSDVTGSIASVNTEQLVAKGATSVMENLQGSVPGVSITQSSGRTNGGFDIEIRGKSSINSSTTPIYVIDGVICSDMDFLNPQDIERIDVLKDASSTAIYGSRATAGVIMVTTKSGAGVNKNKDNACKQKMNISYDGYYGFSKVTRKADFMDGEQFAQYRFLRFLSAVSTATAKPTYYMLPSAFSQGMLTDTEDGSSVLQSMLDNNQTYDWTDIITQDGQKQNHFVSISGSTSDISYRFGVGVTDDKGVYVGDAMRRYNFKGSIDSDLNQYLTAGFSLNAAVTNNEYACDDAVKYAYRTNPFFRPYDDNGDIILRPGNKDNLGTSANQFSDQINPLCYMNNSTKEKITYRLLGNAYFEIKPITGLSIKTTYSPSYTYYRQGEFDDTQYDINDNNEAVMTQSTSWGYTWTNVASYNKTFNSVHNINLMYVNEWNHGTTEKTVMTATDVMDGTYWWNMSSGTYTASSTTTSYSESSMLSHALRANYSYAGKYMFTGTIRWDGSSKFAEGHKWGSFPSLALAWRLSEEGFMESTRDVLSNLKVRLSYGVTGNNAGIGNYATQQTVSSVTYATVGTSQEQAYYPSGVVDTSLSWETSKEFNFGLDYGFINNRISGTFDIYQKNSEDVLYSVTLPLVTGGGTVTTNVGKVQNRGVEVALTGVIIDNSDWHWEVTATFARNVNKVKEINGTGTDLVSSNLFIGKPFNNIYTYTWDGLVTDKYISVPDTEIARSCGFTPGDKVKSYDYYYAAYGWSEGMPIVRDINGDGSINDEDKEVKSSDPKWTGSLSTSVSWKGLDLSCSVYTKQGYEVTSNTYSQYMDYSDRGRNRLNMDFYIPAGTVTWAEGINSDGTFINPTVQQETHYGKYPFPNSALAGSGSGDYWSSICTTVDASFVKIKNITLGYSLPKNILETIHMQKARVYCTVTNPFCWSKDFLGWDPEWASAALKNDGPATVTCEIGLNLKF